METSHNTPFIIDRFIVTNFVVALDAEARPIIDFYQLKRLSTIASHVVYSNNNHSIFLIVSGIGIAASQGAVGFLAGWQLAVKEYASDTINRQDSALAFARATLWINVGIAGHAEQAIGAIFRANKITDQYSLLNEDATNPTSESGYSSVHYPINVLKAAAIPSLPLISYPQPMLDYDAMKATQSMADMEAIGFAMAAKRYASMELVQAIKIISDNSAEPIENKLDREDAKPFSMKAYVSGLIAQRLPEINNYCQQLHKVLAKGVAFEFDDTQSYNVKKASQKIQAHCRFTHAQSVQLHALLSDIFNQYNKDASQFMLLVERVMQKNDNAKATIAALTSQSKNNAWQL